MDRSDDRTALVFAEVISDSERSPRSGWHAPRESLVKAWAASYRPETRRNYGLILADWFAFCDTMGIPYTEVRRSHVELWGRGHAERRQNMPATVAHKLS